MAFTQTSQALTRGACMRLQCNAMQRNATNVHVPFLELFDLLRGESLREDELVVELPTVARVVALVVHVGNHVRAQIHPDLTVEACQSRAHVRARDRVIACACMPARPPTG